MIDVTTDFWKVNSNSLLLNPRLPNETQNMYRAAWLGLVEGHFAAHVGIATSGSSGEFGRLILLSKSALLASAAGANLHLNSVGLSAKAHVWMRTLPLFHVGGLSILARAHLSGARVFESKLQKWNPENFYTELVESGATFLSLVPTQLFDLVQLGKAKHLRAIPTLRAVVVGGGRLDPTLYDEATQLGWPVLPSYGLTECGSQVATGVPKRFASGCTGEIAPRDAAKTNDRNLRILPHVQLRIEKESSLISIASQGLLTAQIHFENGQPRLEDPKVDGWFTTEDHGRLESDGSLTVLGRTQDFIKISGEGVSLLRLEDRFSELKFKLNVQEDVALIAVPDQRLGSKLVLITDSCSPTINSLMAAFNDSVLPFERIRELIQLRAIPRSELGKVLKSKAAKQVAEAIRNRNSTPT